MGDAISTVLLTIGIVFFIEGLIIAIWTKEIQKSFKNFAKSKRHLRHIGVIEIVISVGLILIGILAKA